MFNLNTLFCLSFVVVVVVGGGGGGGGAGINDVTLFKKCS